MIEPDESAMRWAGFQLALTFRRPRYRQHKKWFVEYKRKMRRMFPPCQCTREFMARNVQEASNVA